MAALEKLAAYYETENVDLGAIREHLSPGGAVNSAATAAEPRELGAGFTHSARPGFFIAEGLPTDLVGRLMERMETNDDRIAELTAKSFENSFFGGPTGATETYLRELMGTLAESYLLFRLMQGRNIVAKTARQGRDEPNTIGEYQRPPSTKYTSVAPTTARQFKVVKVFHMQSLVREGAAPAL